MFEPIWSLVFGICMIERQFVCCITVVHGVVVTFWLWEKLVFPSLHSWIHPVHGPCKGIQEENLRSFGFAIRHVPTLSKELNMRGCSAINFTSAGKKRRLSIFGASKNDYRRSISNFTHSSHCQIFFCQANLVFSFSTSVAWKNGRATMPKRFWLMHFKVFFLGNPVQHCRQHSQGVTLNSPCLWIAKLSIFLDQMSWTKQVNQQGN